VKTSSIAEIYTRELTYDRSWRCGQI